MKKSLFLSILLAASALSTTAWAGEVLGSGTSAADAYYTDGTGKFSFDVSNFSHDEGTTKTVYLATDTLSFGSVEADFYWSDSLTTDCNIVIGGAGIYLTDGGSGSYYNFTGTISGTGSWTMTNVADSTTGSGVAQHYAFAGDLSGWSGDFTITTSNAYDYLIFGGTITGANNTTGNINGITATQAVTNTSVSGKGAISVDYGIVEYVYTAGANGQTGETLTVTNTSIEAHTVIFGGCVNYDVSSTVTGWDASSGNTSTTGSTLEISTQGTATFTGKVSGFDIVTVGANSTLAVGSTGALDISGATVNIGSTIQNSGTITIDTDTSFVLGNMAYTGDWTSDDGATYTLITNVDSGTIYIGGEALTSENVSSLDISVSSSSVTITEASFSFVDGTLSVTVKGDTAPIGSTASNPYTGAITDFDLSTWAAGSTVYINGVAPTTETGSYFVNSSTNAVAIVANVDISGDGLSLNNAYSDVIYTFSGEITGNGNWTFVGGSGQTPTQHYIFTGDVSGYSGDFSLTAGTNARSEGYIEFGDGGQAAVNTAVSGTGSITTSTNFAVIYNYGSLADGEETAITISNPSITTADLQFAGSVDYVISAGTTITSASSSGEFTVSTKGTVTILGKLTTGNKDNAFGKLSVAEGSTLRIGADNTFYMDTTSTNGDVFVISGTLEVAEGISFTIRKRSAATDYTIANLSLENGSSLLLDTYGTSTPSAEKQGLAIGTLTVAGSATIQAGVSSDWQNYVSIGSLVSNGDTDATLNLGSQASSSYVTIFELGTSGNTSSESQFTGKISLSETNSGGQRSVSLVISEENIAAGAVIEMGTESVDTDALALGVNAEKVVIAGLTNSTTNSGGDIVYSGEVDIGANLGDAGATLIDYKNQWGYREGSKFDDVGTNRNTLVINTAEGANYSFSGVFMDMLNIEKTGAGTQSIEFKSSTYGESGFYFDGTIAVNEGTLNLSGVETNSSEITVAPDATLNIANAITLTAASDLGSCTSTISGSLSLSGTLTVSSDATLAIESGASVTINSAISNSGVIQIADGASIVVGSELASGIYNGADGSNYEYYELITGSGSGSVELGSSVTFVIDGTEITLSGITTLADGGTNWKGYISGGSLFIYAETSTTAETASDLYWAGTDGNNTWSNQESNTPWSATDGGSSGYYFAEGANVTFGPNTDGSLSSTVVLGDDITAGTVNITGSGYTLTGDGKSLTATSIVLDDKESDDSHTFTIGEGVTVTATTLTESAGQLDLVVNGSLEVTTMTVTNEQSESISGSGKLKVGSLTVSTLQGTSLTIAVSEAEFGSISIVNHSNYGTSDNSSADGYHSLIIGDGQNETKATVTGNLEMTGGTGEVAVAAGSTLTVQGTLIDSSGYKTSISGDGTLIANALSITANSGNNVQISVANLQVGTFTIGAHSGSGDGDATVTISSAKFTADSLTYSSKGNLTISSAEAVIGSIESGETHTLTIADGGNLTTGEIYRSGSTLNLAVNGTLTVEKCLEGYEDSTGMIYFGKDGSPTTMSQTISGSGTVNAYGIEAYFDTGNTNHLTISVANLNIGEGGITESTGSRLYINGTTIGLYEATNVTIAANMVIDSAGAAFNTKSGETLTISGALSGSGAVEKTGVGTLVLSTANSLTGTVTISAGTVEVTNGSALGNSKVSVSSGAKLQLDTAVSTTGTVTFSENAKLVIGGDLLAQLATSYNETESEAVAIITAGNITFGETSLSEYGSISDSDTFDSFINRYVSAGDYMLTWSWSYIEGTGILSASVAGIPEPGIFSTLFGLGALGFVATRRRRRKAA